MGVYIPNMEMPKDGVTIIEIHSNGATFRYSKSFGGWEKVEDAVPVPPHGRLIDADALCDGLVSNHPVMIHANVAPTIIPAEEGE